MGGAWMFFIFQAVILLVISFFVLLGASRATSGGLRIFGRMLAFTLWGLAVYLIVFALYGTYLRMTYFHKVGYSCRRSLNR